MDDRPLQTLAESEDRIAAETDAEPLFASGAENRNDEAISAMRAELDDLRGQIRDLTTRLAEDGKSRTAAAMPDSLSDIPVDAIRDKLDAIIDRLGALPDDGALAPVSRFFRRLDRKAVASVAATVVPMGIQALAGAATKSVPSKLALRFGLPALAAFFIYEALTRGEDDDA
jgi:hypothetical protein